MDETNRQSHYETSTEPGDAQSATGKRTQGSVDYIDWAGEIETTLKAMLGLPVQILGAVLPDETIHHFKAAGRETMLAAYSLWRNVDRAAKGPPTQKVRTHIDVE